MARKQGPKRSELLDTVKLVAIKAAMIIPPWNIFWWIVGGVTYYAFLKKNDTSGDVALGWVLAAPVTIPSLPFVLLRDKLAVREQQRLRIRLQNIADVLCADLRASGITVLSCDVSFLSGISLKTDVPAAKLVAYQNAYAKAVRGNPNIDPSLICQFADPLFPLDLIWSHSVGIQEYAAQVSQPCGLCGETAYARFRWGKDPQAEEDAMNANSSHTILMPDGKYRSIKGTVCRACQEAGWKQGTYPTSCRD